MTDKFLRNGIATADRQPCLRDGLSLGGERGCISEAPGKGADGRQATSVTIQIAVSTLTDPKQMPICIVVGAKRNHIPRIGEGNAADD